MKKILLLILVLQVQFIFSKTEKDSISRFTFQKMMFLEEDDDYYCDACGCSASSGGMGFGTMLYNNFVGIRYLNQSYTSKDGIFANSPWVNENFNTIQLWTKIPITKKFQIFGLIPFQYHSRERTEGTETIQGLGDISVMAMYTVFETLKDSIVLTQKLQLGGGVKMPTGEYNATSNLGNVNKSFQVGTGSWDYILAADYVIQNDNLGLNLLFDYTFKTENNEHYQYGNQVNFGGLFFYLFEINELKIFPHVGLVGEKYDSNVEYGQEVPDTAGNVLFNKFGIEVGLHNFSLGSSCMLPINQNLTGGNVEANYRWSLNLNYSL